ncbi:MAG: SAM-dependent methyltransferase [Eubacteriales bacterium]|nr:SAM-dependent methyltransferase [Eubacteriales bacterium]
MDDLKRLLQESLNKDLYQIILSGAKGLQDGGQIASRKKVRPVLIKGQLLFQVSSYVGKQIFHENLTAEAAADRLSSDLLQNYKQMQVDAKFFSAVALASKKGKVTVKKKLHGQQEQRRVDLSHNRTRKYILEEGRPVPFLIDLGVQTQEGKIVRSRYDKFRQINRFLEFIADVLPCLPKDRAVHIIDFGCGKSYLTFAMYYYLHELQGLELEVTGLDLKEDVIENCSALAKKYGYDGLHFLHGDIADYTGTQRADMVVTLHACDTATDYALYKAIKWEAKVILSVPCCQHEVNGQIACEALDGALRYGLIKERLSALFTDALRADLLEENGYDTQVLEFIDMEHTPKNILLRAVKSEKQKKTDPASRKLAETLHVSTTLQRLLGEEK